MTTASSSFTGQTAAAAAEPDLARPTRKVPGGAGRRSAWYRRLTPYLFLLVPVGLLLLLTYTPVVNMFWYSVTDWDGLDKTKNFIGLDNYVEVFTDPDNLRVFYVSLFYVVGSFVQMALALYFATILSFKVRFKNMWKGILFFPYLINGVAIGLIFLNFLKPGGGLDTVLMKTGLESLVHQWTGDPDIANFSLAAVSVWRYTGLTFVMFLGAIQSINSEIYEAAALDGASGWQRFRLVTLPLLLPTVVTAAVLRSVDLLRLFDIIYLTTQGGPGTASTTLNILAYRRGFEFSDLGYASAIMVTLSSLVLGSVLVFARLRRAVAW